MQVAFTNLQSNEYKNYTECYTDGSVIKEPINSTASAIAIGIGDEYLTQSWKLHNSCSIYVAELFAIYQALLLTPKKVQVNAGLVIYSDSLSSILALQDPENKSSMHLNYTIQELVQKLTTEFPVKIQYVPSHKNIKGNEIADGAAKAGHNNRISLITPVTNDDFIRICREKLWMCWREKYADDVMNFGKGIHFYSNKPIPKHWPWSSHKSRTVETTLAKLRIGHIGLNSHLYRIKKSDSDMCSCGSIETVDHFLLIAFIIPIKEKHYLNI